MSLKQSLISKKPRETSGSRSANSFDFQKSWSLCRLLELHRAGKDYVIVFDYHDDVLVLDSATNPNRIDFYQIKTKRSGHWTRGDLIGREKGKDGPLSSVLGKLLSNKLAFPDHTQSMHLISTQGFKLSVNGSPDSVAQQVCLRDLTDKELTAILRALKEEHSLPSEPDCADCMHLSVTSLSLGDHPTHAMGILAEFLEAAYPGQKVPLPAIFKTLCDEIKRRAHGEGQPGSFEELCAKRSFSRESFGQLLQDIRPAGDFDGALKEAMDQLRGDNIGWDDIRLIREACTLFEVERMDSTNLVLRRAREAIARAVKEMRDSGSTPTRLADAIQAVTTTVEKDTTLLLNVKTRHYRSAMILMALYGF